jgi:CBS domain-containing protein
MVTNLFEQQVRDVLSKDVVTIRADATVHEALELMVENHISALPVIDEEDHCVGMVSATDLIALTRELDEELSLLRLDDASHQLLLDKLADHDMGRRPVTELMSTEVESVGKNTRLVQAARKMLRFGVHRLPVLDEHGRLEGVVSTTDILAAFVDAGEA